MSLSYKNILAKAHYHNIEKNIIDNYLKKAANGKAITLLDVGCGIGEYVETFKKYNIQFTGVDVSQEMVDNANKAGHNAILLDDLKKQNDLFDIVFISHVIEHLDSETLVEFLNFYIGKLKKDGILILLSPLGVDNFYYDITHVRAYYPQAIWQMWGGYFSSLSIQKNEQLRLDDIYFVKDSYRTRKWRSYYMSDNKIAFYCTRFLNYILASLYLMSNATIGRKTSWIGFYKKL
jgi:cyclopropane fatty-acyl-phospholipid synthase-like methyltransferase